MLYIGREIFQIVRDFSVTKNVPSKWQSSWYSRNKIAQICIAFSNHRPSLAAWQILTPNLLEFLQNNESVISNPMLYIGREIFQIVRDFSVTKKKFLRNDLLLGIYEIIFNLIILSFFLIFQFHHAWMQLFQILNPWLLVSFRKSFLQLNLVSASLTYI